MAQQGFAYSQRAPTAAARLPWSAARRGSDSEQMRAGSAIDSCLCSWGELQGRLRPCSTSMLLFRPYLTEDGVCKAYCAM